MTFKRILSFVLTLVFCLPLCVLTTAGKSGDNELFVAPGGSDTGDGSAEHPFATIEKAKEAAKTLDGSVTVYLRGGSYTLNSTVSFTGSDKSDITFKAYNGEKAMLTSGTPYTGFEECSVNGVKAFKKDIGKDADFNVLFNSETTLKRTRYPETGYLYVKEARLEDTANPEVKEGYFLAHTAMYADKNDLKDFKNTKDVMVRILHYWKDEMLTVTSCNTQTGYVTFSRPTSMTVSANDRYFLENVFEALNEPGEWYLDKSEGVLYYIPFEGENAGELTLWGSEAETLISIDGVDGISFENLVFRGNGFNIPKNNTGRDDSSQAGFDASQCIKYSNANNFHITNCEFRDIAGGAVYFGTAVKNASVESSYFENLGAQAVFVQGVNVQPDDERITKDITISNNCISGYGKNFFNAVGILIIHANSVNVCNNEIHDGYYTAISVGWVWGYSYTVTYNNKICNNLIYNIGQGWLSDMGGIYTLGNQPGTVLSGNVIHNVSADPGQGGYGGWGIYLDEGSAYILVEKNLVYACGNDSYHLHYGSYNTVRNNIFALSGESQIRVVSNLGRVTPADGGKETAAFTKNIILTDKNVRALSYMTDTAAFSEDGNIYWDISEGDRILTGIDGNVKKAMALKKAQKKGFVNNPVITDPQFKDALNFDFELKETSPVFDSGFEAWDYSQAGTVKGTTVGLSFKGGSTPYNADSRSTPLTPAKDKWGRLNKILDFFRTIFEKIFGTLLSKQ